MSGVVCGWSGCGGLPFVRERVGRARTGWPSLGTPPPGPLPQGEGEYCSAVSPSQTVNQTGQSENRGSSLSLSDSSGPLGGTGQGSARSGSFQITPRSAARSYGPETL